MVEGAMGPKRIVVADDTKAVRQMVRDALELHGYEIHEASNGLDALVRIDEIQPDLVVLDIQMPYLTGLEVLYRLRGISRYQGLRIIAFSAEVTAESEKRLLGAGFNACIPKPVNIAVLLAAVEAVLTA